jgi:hypothetical protein
MTPEVSFMMLLESSIMLLENIYSISHDDRHLEKSYFYSTGQLVVSNAMLGF